MRRSRISCVSGWSAVWAGFALTQSQRFMKIRAWPTRALSGTRTASRRQTCSGDPQLDGSKTDNQPGVHEVVAEMRATANKFDSNRFPGTRVLVGETYLPNIGELKKMYGARS